MKISPCFHAIENMLLYDIVSFKQCMMLPQSGEYLIQVAETTNQQNNRGIQV